MDNQIIPHIATHNTLRIAFMLFNSEPSRWQCILNEQFDGTLPSLTLAATNWDNAGTDLSSQCYRFLSVSCLLATLRKMLTFLFHAWLDIFTLVKLGVQEVCALEMLLVYHHRCHRKLQYNSVMTKKLELAKTSLV